MAELFAKVVDWARRRKTTLLSVGAMSGSQAVVVVLGIAGGLIQARYINPDVMGHFSAFAILAGYLTFLHFGSLTSLQREYPYWMGKNDNSRAEHAAAVTQGWILIVCAAVALLYGVLAALAMAKGDRMGAVGWASQLVVTATGFYSLYLGCTYRSNSEFLTWSMVTVLQAILGFALLPLVVWWGFWGLCIRSGAPILPVIWLLHRLRPVKVGPRFSWHELWEQVRFGLPMDLAGFFATSCMLSTMSGLAGAGYGLEVLGLYAFARYAESAMTQFGVAVTQVFVPRISLRMGQTDSMVECARYSVKPTLVCTAVVAAVALVGTICCPILIRMLTPKYIAAAPIAQILLWSGLYPTLLLPKHVFVAAKENIPVATGFIACFVVFVMLGALAIFLHLSASWIAMAFIAGKAANVVVCYLWLWRRCHASERTPYLAAAPVTVEG